MNIVVPCIRLALDMFIEVQIDVKIIDNPVLNYITRVQSLNFLLKFQAVLFLLPVVFRRQELLNENSSLFASTQLSVRFSARFN